MEDKQKVIFIEDGQLEMSGTPEELFIKRMALPRSS